MGYDVLQESKSLVPMPMEFINADLEIISQESLDPLKDAFAQYGDRLFEMYCGETDPGCYLASFEIHPDEDRDDHTAEEKIHAFCASITELRGLARELWLRATRRVIDLGYLADTARLLKTACRRKRLGDSRRLESIWR